MLLFVLHDFLQKNHKQLCCVSLILSDNIQASQMVTGNAVIVGVNILHDQILDYASSQFTLREGNGVTSKLSRYYGGEARHKSLMKDAHVAIAGQGASLKNMKVAFRNNFSLTFIDFSFFF